MAFSRSLVAVHGPWRIQLSNGRRAAVTLGFLSMLVTAPAWAGNVSPQPSTLSSSTSSANARTPSPLKLSIPGLGGRKLELSYSGPVAPWKVLNPMHKGERQSSFAVVGPNTAKGQTVHTVTFSSARDTGGRRSGMTISSTRTSAGSTESKSLDVGGSVERKGGATQMSHHATFDAHGTRANGSESHLSVSGRVTSSQPVGGPSSSTHELRADSSSRRIGAGGVEHETRSGVVQSMKTSNQTTHEATASRNLTRPGGGFQEQGISVRVGAQPAAGEQRTIVAKVGQVTGRDGVAEKGDGVILKRGANGDVSSKVVAGGENRTRSLTLGDQTHRQGLLARFKSGVVGEKNPIETSFKNGVPAAD